MICKARKSCTPANAGDAGLIGVGPKDDVVLEVEVSHKRQRNRDQRNGHSVTVEVFVNRQEGLRFARLGRPAPCRAGPWMAASGKAFSFVRAIIGRFRPAARRDRPGLFLREFCLRREHFGSDGGCVCPGIFSLVGARGGEVAPGENESQQHKGRKKECKLVIGDGLGIVFNLRHCEEDSPLRSAGTTCLV